MTGARVRRAAVLAGLAGSLLTVLAGTRRWAGQDGVPVVGEVWVSGREAAPVVVAVALATAVGALVLGTAGRAARYAVAALLLAGGLLAAGTAAGVGRDPADAAAPALARATGVSVPWDLRPATATAWPWVAAAGGLLTAAAGALALGTARRWPAAGRRFEREGGPAPSGPAQPADSWDALTRGEDPT